MSFTYDDPSGSPVEEIRFLIGDVTAPGLLSDEEITYYVTRMAGTYTGNLMTAAFCADAIAARYAGEVSINADGVTYSGDQLQQKYATVAVSLRSDYCTQQSVGAEAFAGGTNPVDMWPWGVVPLNFGVGMHDNARAGTQRFGYYGDLLAGEASYEADDGSGP